MTAAEGSSGEETPPRALDETRAPSGEPALGSLREHEESRTAQRYERLERLGAGGMAIVWKAVDHKLHREVAVKELREEVALVPEGLARFKHEAEAIARLSHPNVVAFYDAVEEGPRTFLVMELVRGDSMARLLEKKRPNLRAIVEMLEKVARGVQHAHERGIVHRDLKPSNVLVTEAGEPKVSDFGLAHLAGELVTTLTKTGALLGTPAYMAPEQARGDRHAIGPRTDVYALGAMLYEVLAGRPPFQGDSVHELVHSVVNVEPIEPRKLDPKVPLDLQTIALKCLAKEPDRRYATAREFGDELHRWLEGQPIEARPPSHTELVALWVRRNRRLAVVLSALVLAVGIAGLAWGARFREGWLRERVVETELARVVEAPAESGAADRIVAVADERTVAILCAALDGVTEELRLVARDAYLSAKEPLPDEARSGQEVIEGLEAAVDAYLGGGDVPAGGAYDLLLAKAMRRLEDRAQRAAPKTMETPDPDSRVLVAGEQERRTGAGRRRLAVFACEVLGRIGRPQAETSLARFLAAVHTESAAAVAGEALARIGGASAEHVLYEARLRFGGSGLFWQRVQPHLRESGREAVPQTSSEALRERGIRRAQAGDLPGAIADLTSAIALDPSDALAWFNRGSARLEAHDPDGALLDFSKAVSLRPQDGGFISMRGSARRAKGDLDGAIADYTRAIELEPERMTPWLSRGNARRAKGDLRGALADLTSAIALVPGNPAAWCNRALTKKAMRDFKGALEDYAKALELDPNHVVTLVNRGSLLSDRGEVARAMDDFTRALAINPRLPDALVNRGLAHSRRGEHDAAIEDFTRAIDVNARIVEAWWLRGRAWKDKGDFDRAIPDLERACSLNARAVGPRADLGTVRWLAGDLEGAKRDLTRAIELDPRNALAYTNRGVVRGLLGDRKGLIADSTKAIELDPRRADALANRGAARAKDGDLEGALDDVSRAIDVAPMDPNAYFVRAGLRIDAEDLAGARADIDRTLDLAPRHAEAWAKRSVLRQRERDLAGAIEDATRALELEPRNVTALVNRGTVRLVTGDRPGAIADLTRALEIAPVGSNAETARKALDEARK